MKRVFYFSGSGHSRAVAQYLAALLEYRAADICAAGLRVDPEDTAAVVFPVYCENIPEPVINFMRELPPCRAALIATYGRVSYGNVLYEAQQLFRGTVIAGAYIPTGHTFLNGDISFTREPLDRIAQRMKDPKAITLPRTPKNPLSDLSPALRSRIGTRITKNSRCDGCGLCEANCPMKAIQGGRITAQCIRCLRCVTSCPQKALEYRNISLLDLYLRHHQKNETRLYL